MVSRPDGLVINLTSIDKTQEYQKKISALSTVKLVTSIATFLKSEEEQQRRITFLKQIRAQGLNINTSELEVKNTIARLKTLKEILNNYKVNIPNSKLPDHIATTKALTILTRDEVFDTSQKPSSIEPTSSNAHTSAINSQGLLNKKKSSQDKMPPDNRQENQVTSIDALIKSIQDNQNSIHYLQTQLIIGTSLKKFFNLASNPKPITLENIPHSIKRSFIAKDNQNYLMTIFPSQNPWPIAFRSEFIKSVHDINAKATGLILIADKLYKSVRYDSIRVTLLCLLFVFLISWLVLKKFILALSVIIPTCLAAASMLGIMGLFDIHFDFINLISLPLLVGIGVDYALHIVIRYLEENECNIDLIIKQVGRAILLSVCTTIIGAAAIIPASMNSISSTGIIVVIAASLCYIYTMVLYS